MKMQVFDPPMCCSTGVCGPSVDPKLVQFAADLDWLAEHGVEVERFNLSQQAAVFAGTPIVSEMLGKEGNDCLPLIVAEGAVLSKGQYPTRQVLAGFAGIRVDGSIFTDAVKELVAIGAAIGSNCEMCFKHRFNQARKLGVSKDDIRLAVAMAQSVKESPAQSITVLAQKYVEESPAKASSCCCGPSADGETTGGGKSGKGPCC
jgi:AhpD family alkylhydroperoxidase